MADWSYRWVYFGPWLLRVRVLPLGAMHWGRSAHSAQGMINFSRTKELLTKRRRPALKWCGMALILRVPVYVNTQLFEHGRVGAGDKYLGVQTISSLHKTVLLFHIWVHHKRVPPKTGGGITPENNAKFSQSLLQNEKFRYGSFHQVGARFVRSFVTSINVPSIILDYKCTFTVVLQIRIKSISPPSIEITTMLIRSHNQG